MKKIYLDYELYIHDKKSSTPVIGDILKSYSDSITLADNSSLLNGGIMNMFRISSYPVERIQNENIEKYFYKLEHGIGLNNNPDSGYKKENLLFITCSEEKHTLLEGLEITSFLVRKGEEKSFELKKFLEENIENKNTIIDNQDSITSVPELLNYAKKSVLPKHLTTYHPKAMVLSIGIVLVLFLHAGFLYSFDQIPMLGDNKVVETSIMSTIYAIIFVFSMFVIAGLIHPIIAFLGGGAETTMLILPFIVGFLGIIIFYLIIAGYIEYRNERKKINSHSIIEGIKKICYYIMYILTAFITTVFLYIEIKAIINIISS